MNREIELAIKVTQENMDEIRKEIIDFCREQDIKVYRQTIGNENMRFFYFYFTILGRTKEFDKIVGKFGRENIEEVGYAEVGNKLDLDPGSFEKWKKVLNDYYLYFIHGDTKYGQLSYLIEKLDNVDQLELILKYPLDDRATELIKNKIAHLKGEEDSYILHIKTELEREKLVELLDKVIKGEVQLGLEELNQIRSFIQKS